LELIANARADLIDGFGAPSLCVESDGGLVLICADRAQVFDRRGTPVDWPTINGDLLERQGEFISTAIDSRIEACVWHRIELRGAIPPGCSIEVQTATAEIELTSSELDNLPEHAWVRCEPARAMQPGPGNLSPDCSWDTLPNPPPGRYLWLRLVFHGDGRVGPCLSSVIIEYPRISLRRYLPNVFGMDPVGADFTDRFAAIFERTLRTIEDHLDRLSFYFDPLTTPATPHGGHPDFLSWLGDMIGVSLSGDWPESRRRHFIKEVARTYSLRGTPEGLRRQLMLLLGFDTAFSEHCLAERRKRRCIPRPRNCNPCPPCLPAESPPLLLEHFKLRRWLHVGRGKLGSDAELWGRQIVGRSELTGDSPASGQAKLGVTSLNSVPDPLRDPFHVYAHKLSVFVPASIRSHPPIRRALEQLVEREIPAHVQADIRYVEPRFRVGIQSMIGLDSVIARTPLGVTLAQSRLRQGTLLTSRPRSPDFEVGKARVGTTARLT
jgi:phage tail-like protein